MTDERKLSEEELRVDKKRVLIAKVIMISSFALAGIVLVVGIVLPSSQSKREKEEEKLQGAFIRAATKWLEKNS